jgi:hypothetical protein
MHSEIANGDSPELTSLVGASAPPSHTPAASAQATPSACTDRKLAPAFLVAFNRSPLFVGYEIALVERDEKREPNAKHKRRDKEVTVGEDGFSLCGGFHL